MAHGAGPEVLEGVMCTVNWYWGLRDRFPGSKVFVDAFRAKYGKPPGSAAACAWVAIHEWASAAKRAGDFAPDRIIKALEGHKFTLLKDREEWRSWDHQAISSVFIAQGKSKKESKEPWDILKIIGEKKGPVVMRSPEENPVTLERLATER
jgi:ABC-type branched-subunit amino acid transport system substrate-binding protein